MDCFSNVQLKRMNAEFQEYPAFLLFWKKENSIETLFSNDE